MSFGAERQRETAVSAPKANGCCIRPKNKTGQLKKGCLVCCFHIINLNETNRKQVARAGLFDVLKNHAFCMSPLRLNREMLMFGTLGLPYFKKKSAAANMT